MNQQKFTGEQYVPGYTPKRIEEDHLCRYKFAIQFVRNKVVLDVACGTGYGSDILKDGGASQVVGVDINKEVIEYAIQNYQSEQIIFQIGNATSLKYQDNYFDVIVSFETLEHIKDRYTFLNELKRVLRPGGLLIISTPNKSITSPFTKKPLNKYHFVEFTQEQLEDILSKYFYIQKWFGQRFIRKIFTKKNVRKCVQAIQIVAKRDFGIYNIANGPEIIPLKSANRVPRYFIVICKKILK